MIKFEVDQNPPLGYQLGLTMVSTEFLTAINHFNLPSLFAGKLHAILCRNYEKGRDYYDLIWYLGQNITPNFRFLNNAMIQTETKTPNLTTENIYQTLIQKVEHVNFNRLRKDIQPFLMDPKEIRYFEQSFFIKLLESKIT